MRQYKLIITAASILLAVAAPAAAATRLQNSTAGYSAYASGADRSGAFYYGPQGYSARAQATDAQPLTPAQHQYNRTPLQGQNLPYPDRPYGAPDSW